MGSYLNIITLTYGGSKQLDKNMTLKKLMVALFIYLFKFVLTKMFSNKAAVMVMD